MTRLSVFDSPLFLGFDHFEQTLDRLKKSGNDGYPPYNIEQIGENGLRITLAVAGFSMDDLEVELDYNQLTIRGKQSEKNTDDDRIFLHRGIATRQFQRNFVLADGIEILGASLDNGLLHIEMQQKIPEKSAQKIEITQKKSGSGNGKTTQETIEVETIKDEG